MVDILSVVNGAITTLQKLREISQKVKDAETSNLIADLNIALADLKMKFAELQEENLRLKNELNEAHTQADIRGMVTLRNGLYYLKQPVDDRPEGPYCTRCLDVEGKAVLVAQLARTFHAIAKYQCPNCKARYGGRGI